MKISTKAIVLVGMFTAILSVLSILAIPMPSGVPVTLQTFGVALCGYVLGWKSGFATTGVYVLLGTAGVPVFSGMKGGPAVLFGYTGGFLWGFILMALLCGMAANRKNALFKIGISLLGLVCCHLPGVIQFQVLSSNSLMQSFLLVSLPYLLKDAVSMAGAYFAAESVKKALPLGMLE